MHFAGNPFSGKIPVHTTVPHDRGAFKVFINSEKSYSLFIFLSLPHTPCTKAALSLPWHLTLFTISRPGTHTARRWEDRMREWPTYTNMQSCSVMLHAHAHCGMLQVYWNPQGKCCSCEETGTCCSTTTSLASSVKVIRVSYHIMSRKLTAPGACMKSRLQFG